MRVISYYVVLLLCSCALIQCSEFFMFAKSRAPAEGPMLKDGDKVTTDTTLKVDPEKAKAAASVNVGFVHAFVASISVIIVSELGDKTFFIAAIMAMRHSRTTVFIGAICALGLMTVLSTFVGYATTIIPRKFTFYVSTALFVIFGLKMLKEGYYMDPNEGQEELEEVTAELKKRDEEIESQNPSTVQDLETGIIRTVYQGKSWCHFLSPIFLQSFTMTFLAEWGDRSQLTTIILASREDPLGVTVGGTLGHALCTGLAVLGGRLVAQRISVRTVTLVGGVVFLLFALTALLFEEGNSL